VFPHFRNSHPSPTVRPQRIIQATLFENFAEHEIGRELRAMSQWLDQHRELLGLVMNDLRGCEVRATGRDGCRRKPWCAARC
jgi:transposase, IS5 family